MTVLLRNPLLRLAGRLWWLPVLVVGTAWLLGGERALYVGATALAGYGSFVLAMTGTAWADGALAASREARRHARLRHRFLCPECLHFGELRDACGGCGAEIEPFMVRTGGKYVNECVACHNAVFARDGARGRGVRAYCARCRRSSDAAIFHERSVRVVVTTTESDLEAVVESAPSDWTITTLDAGCVLDDGTRLTVVLEAGALPEGTPTLDIEHAAFSIEALWLGGCADEPLALGQSVDRLLRQTGGPRARWRSVPVFSGEVGLDPAVRNLLAARFGEIRCGSTREEFLGASSR